MSTNDVPGANDANNDTLAMGCWAEHEDGSLVFVKSVEGGRVIYEMYDVTSDPITQYTDAMPEDGFKREFTWDPNKKDSVKWTWHDKTPFPWDRVIKQGAKDGVGYASAHDQLSAAARVAASLKLTGKDVDPDDLAHLLDQVGDTGRSVVETLQRAIGTLPTSDAKSRQKRKVLQKAQDDLDAIETGKRKKFLGMF